MGRFLALLSALLMSSSAHSYIKTVTQNGTPVSWRDPLKLNLAGNPINQVGITENSFRDAVVKGLSRWKAAAAGSIGFDYWQGTDGSIFEANAGYNGLSSIYFASNSDNSMSSNVIGVTQVWYNTATGQILEADIGLNDIDFNFTTNPRDSTGTGISFGIMTAKKVFIENVITHEIGHAFGLTHSGVLQSSMLFMESPEQALLACDDQSGIRALYPNGEARGSISGQIISDRTGTPVFGAHVLAISQKRGTTLAGGITDPSGNYHIEGIEPGTYFVMVEPYYAGSSPLPGYYDELKTRICSGSQFSRSFLEDSGGNLSPISVYPGSNTPLSPIPAVCNAGTAAVDALPGTSSPVTGPSLEIHADGGFGMVDRQGGSAQYYRLQNISGSLSLHVLSYSLYSPIAPNIRLLDLNGNPVAGVSISNTVYTGASGYGNRDSALIASSLPFGDYFLEVSATRLTSGTYPAGSISIDSGAFFVISGGINQSEPSAAYPHNARCKMDENFASYTSPPGMPPRFVSKDNAAPESAGGFCGRIQTDDDSGSGPTPPGLILGWFLPWGFMLASIRAIRWWGLRAQAATVNLG